MKKCTALMMDVIASRSYTSKYRSEIQYLMKDASRALNEVFRSALEYEVRFSGGDSLQGVFHNPQCAILYLRLFRLILNPVGIRVGIGSGTLDLVIKGSSDTNEQDGKVYHNARYAIDSTNEHLGYSTLYCSNSNYDTYVNTLLCMCTELQKRRTFLQNELALIIEALAPLDYKMSIDLTKIGSIVDLIQKREFMNLYRQANGRRQNEFLAKNYGPPDFVIDCDYLPDELYVNAGKVKGVSDSISRMLGQSRQSIDKTIKLGRINEERNAIICLIEFLSAYGGNR